MNIFWVLVTVCVFKNKLSKLTDILKKIEFSNHYLFYPPDCPRFYYHDPHNLKNSINILKNTLNRSILINANIIWKEN